MIKKIDQGNEKIIITQNTNGAVIDYHPSLTTKENIKIKQAVLKLPTNVKNQNEIYEVNNIITDDQGERLVVIDRFQKQSQDNLVCIDISDELQDLLSANGSVLKLNITRANQDNIDFFDGAEVLITYFNKKDSLNSSSYEIDCKRAGQGSINLSTGALSFTHNDLACNQNALSIKIDHIFNSFLANKSNDTVDLEEGIINIPDFKCGKGWKLNIQQYLVKEKKLDSLLSDGESASKFTYINSDGKHEEFLEKYQYEDSNGKTHFIQAADVHIDQDGNLSFYDELGVYRPVEQKFVTDTGLSLSTRYEDFTGLSLVEQDGEEVANLRSDVENLRFNITDLENNISATKSNLDLAKKSSDINELNQSLQSLSLQNEELTLDNETALKDSKQSYTNVSREYRNLCDARTYRSVNGENQPTSDEKSAKETLNSISDFIEDQNSTLSETVLENRKEMLLKNKALFEDNASYLQNQNEAQTLQLEKSLAALVAQLEMYNKLLVQKEHQLAQLEKQMPIHYITDDEGITLGFGRTSNDSIYRLILIADNFENAAYISFNDNDEIESIKTSDSKEIVFAYKNNKLFSITDTKNRKTIFEYEDDLLSCITYPNKLISKFEYVDGQLSFAEEPSGYGFMLNYDGERVVQIDEITKTKLISKDNKEDNQQPLINNSVGIDYYDIRSTILTNNTKHKVLTYIFDSMGQVTTIYENKFEDEVIGNVRVTTYDRVNDKKSFKISSLEKSPDFLKGVLFEGTPEKTSSENYLGDNFVCGGDFGLVVTSTDTTPTFDDNIYKINQSENTVTQLIKELSSTKIKEIINSKATDFVLAGWAKADSAWVNRRCTDYSNNSEFDDSLDSSEINNILIKNMDTEKLNRRFELRAELTYNNKGQQRVVEQYCSFDWMNTGWQYCAFPVTLSEDADDELVGARFIFDYSNNTNEAEFFGMNLKEGLWEYSEYNDDKLVTYYENSHTDIITTYEYEGKKLVKEIKTKNDILYPTTYQYDVNGSLKRIVTYDGIVNENEYNDKGILIKSYMYHKTEPSCKFYSEEKVLDENGNNKSEFNEFGEEISENTYIEKTTLVKSSKLKNGKIIAYGYDRDDDTLLSATINMSNENNTNVYGYNFNMLTSLSHNNFEYNYEYDGFGRQTKIDIAGQIYQTIQYDKFTTTYILGSGEKFVKNYDEDGNLLTVVYHDEHGNDKLIVENVYDTYGSLLATNDYTNEDETVQCNIEYDKFGNAIKKYYVQNAKEIKIETSTNEYENKSEETFTIDDKNSITKYTYDEDLNARLNKINFVGKAEQNIFYDNLGRIKQTKLSNILTKNYNYLQKGDHSSNLVASEWFGNDKVLKDSLKYSYDEYGNVVSVKENGIEIVRYTYDDLSRLVREDNKKLNKTITYFYDKGGNIVEYYVYPYTTNETSQLLNGTRVSYSYPINGWRDQMQSFNGEQCEYDILGNPTIYRNKALIWNFGRQLTKFGDFEYKYNAEGIRTSKTISGKTTQYYLDGTKILAQDDGNLLTFMYGVDGVVGFTYDGVGEYFYKKNIFGDIIGILDKNGQEIVKYAYDAWGNHKTYVLNDGTFVDISTQLSYTQEGSNNKLIAEINPFRYRGYYYDAETKLYYLNSRYYDPETGRFINADEISNLDESSLNGLNLFIYCGNNPITFTDPFGNTKWWEWLLSALIAIVVVVAVVAVTVLTAGIGTAIGTALGGTAAAMIFGSAAGGAITGAITGAIMSFGISTIKQGLTNGYDNINWGQVGIETLIGAASGFVSGAIFGAISGTVKVMNAAKAWAPTGGKSGFKQMTEHYTKHVIKEGQQGAVKNILNYTKQATEFFAQNNTSGVLLREGVIKIAGAPGGIFNTNGLIRSFWYILKP